MKIDFYANTTTTKRFSPPFRIVSPRCLTASTTTRYSMLPFVVFVVASRNESAVVRA